MNTEIQNKLEKKYMKKLPKFDVGDTIAVTTIIREGDKQRTQTFNGIVLSIKGTGIRKTFTIRKISMGVGVEKILPFNSPNISKLVVLKRGNVRKSKIYYMRKRIGKKALKIGERKGKYVEEMLDDVTEGEPAEVIEEPVIEEVTEKVADEPETK